MPWASRVAGPRARRLRISAFQRSKLCVTFDAAASVREIPIEVAKVAPNKLVTGIAVLGRHGTHTDNNFVCFSAPSTRRSKSPANATTDLPPEVKRKRAPTPLATPQQPKH